MSVLGQNSSSWESCEIDVFRDKPLGSGAYGIVCKAKIEHLPCAAKLLHPTFLVPGNWAVDKFMQECSFLASLKHPNIVQFLGVHTERTTGQAVLLMELMEESLTMFVKRHKSSNQLVPLHTQMDISHDVILAMHYLHAKGIIHRDLSSNNILLIGGSRAKITDFGMSKLTLNVSTSLSSLTQVPGCPVYMPPEAWVTPPIYTEKLDVFSFGVILLQLATCRQPNPGPSETLELNDSSPTGYIKVPVPEVSRRSEDIDCMDSDHILRELTLKCLQDKAILRPSASDICESIEAAKTTPHYTGSSSKPLLKSDIDRKSSDSSSKERRGSLPNNEANELLKKELIEKDQKIEKLSNEVVKLSSEITGLKQMLQTKEEEITKLQQQKPATPNKEGTVNPSIHRRKSEFENICLTGLSPEVLSVISKDPSSSVPSFCVEYHDISRGEVSFQYLPEYESKEQTIKIFLQFYQHVFNSLDVRVGFISIPPFFPQSLLPEVLKLCSMKQQMSTFKHIQLVNVVKIISNTPEVHTENIERISNLLNLRINLSQERTLTIKQGNIIDEDVAIIVSSANPPLLHRVGIAAAINAASQFEVQKHADAYVKKHGVLQVGDIACTKAGGNLKCNWVIHAVGPAGIAAEDESIASKSSRDEVIGVMKGLIHKILHKADELQAKSIAIPAISTGSLQLAISISMLGILEGVLEHKFTSSSKLSDIRITIMRDEIFSKFIELFVNYQLKANDLVPSSLNQKRVSCPDKLSSTPPSSRLPSASGHRSPSLPTTNTTSAPSLSSHVTYHMTNCKQQ